MLTKTLKVGDEVFVTQKGFRNEITSLGVFPIAKVGRLYLHVEVNYSAPEKFNFNGVGTDSRYELWDSEESYKTITKRQKERASKIKQIQAIVSDYKFGNNLRDEALDEILQLITSQAH